MNDLFNTPTSRTKVSAGVYAYRYANGTINIEGKKYIGYSIKEAIKLFKNTKP